MTIFSDMSFFRKCDLKRWVAPSFALSFMFCVFAPLEAYFSNESEYWFRLSHLVPVALCAFLVLFLVLLLAGALLGRTRAADATYAFLLVALVCFYVQGNYVPRPYGVLNGDSIDWGSPKFNGVAFAGVSIFAVGLAIWGCAVASKAVARRLLAVGQVVFPAIAAIQLVTLATLYLEKDVFGEPPKPSFIVRADNMFNLGSETNILVIVLDTFDSHFLTEILNGEEGKFAKGVLRDFTYYPDTLGMYPTTKGALPHILTGVAASNDVPYDAYLERAYNGNPLYSALAEKGYSVELYARSRFVADDFPVENIVRGDYRIEDKCGFAKMMCKLVAFNYLPHHLKSRFMVDGDDFLTLRKAVGNIDAHVYRDDVQRFFGLLKKASFSVSAGERSFRFYHLAGTHPPYTFGKTLKVDEPGPFSYLDESLGCLTLLKLFFKKLREGGCYDNSTIVIMADHGRVDYRQNPVFLVKNVQESHPFRISKAKMSYAYWIDCLTDLVQTGTPITEKAIKARAGRNGERTYLYYEWENGWERQYLPRLREMRLAGSASLEGNARFEFTGAEFSGAWKDEKYVLGTLIKFGKSGNADKYLNMGFYKLAKCHRTYGEKAVVRMKLSGKFDKLFLDLGRTRLGYHPPILLYANDVPVTNCLAWSSGRRYYVIDPSCIDDSRLLVMRFEIPRMRVPDESDPEDDPRQRIMFFSGMRLFSDLDDRIPRKKTISFVGRKGAPARKWCFEGIGKIEPDFTWTTSERLVMRFVTTPKSHPEFAVTLKYGTFLPEEHVVVSANNVEIANYVAKGEETRRFDVPPDCIPWDGVVELVFTFPDAISPRELKQGGDDRRLALKLYSMRVD